MGGVVNLTRQLAADLAPEVRVNAVAPGPVGTEHLYADLSAASYGGFEGAADAVQAVTQTLPLRRIIEPDEVARAVCFLAGLECDDGLGAERRCWDDDRPALTRGGRPALTRGGRPVLTRSSRPALTRGGRPAPEPAAAGPPWAYPGWGLAVTAGPGVRASWLTSSPASPMIAMGWPTGTSVPSATRASRMPSAGESIDVVILSVSSSQSGLSAVTARRRRPAGRDVSLRHGQAEFWHYDDPGHG